VKLPFVAFCVIVSSCTLTSAQTSTPAATHSSKPQPAKAATSPASPKVKFRPYEVIDQKQGGMAVSRLAVPENWKTSSRVDWNYNDFYLPVYVSARTEAPDGSSWIEFFPAEFFLWIDAAHDRAPIGRGSIGGIHHPNITLQEAMVRYVIGPSRSSARNLHIVGSRAVDDLPRAFPKVFDQSQGRIQGEGICMRVSYELNGSPMDEEFYGFMTTTEAINAPSRNPRLSMVEYHRRLLLVHSMGAKSGKLETVRPLLGFVATSLEPNPAWQQRVGEVRKLQGEYYQRVQASNYAEIQAAGARSRALTAQSDQFIRQIDANLAAQNNARNAAPSSFSSNDDFYKRADDFDQNIRGTEHLQDQNGVVTDQYTDYNYHWTDGFGRYVHTDDPNLDPNKYLNGNYQLMTPPPR
jgi:hypothetical protein